MTGRTPAVEQVGIRGGHEQGLARSMRFCKGHCSYLITLVITLVSRVVSGLWPLRRDSAALGGSALQDKKEMLPSFLKHILTELPGASPRLATPAPF